MKRKATIAITIIVVALNIIGGLACTGGGNGDNLSDLEVALTAIPVER